MSQGTPSINSSSESLSASTVAASESDVPAVVNGQLRHEDPWVIIGFFVISCFILKLWWADFKDRQAGTPNPKALPGATTCPPTGLCLAIIGSLLLLLVETLGEYALGISAQQSNITVLFLVSMVAAAFIEEIIFRGYLVCENRGKAALLASIFGFSLLFALLHPHLWKLDFAADVPAWQVWNGSLSTDFSAKAWFSTAALFLGSIWFYTVRFYAWNPNHSLLPCFAAHLAKNIGVFAIKCAQGHVVQLY